MYNIDAEDIAEVGEAIGVLIEQRDEARVEVAELRAKLAQLMVERDEAMKLYKLWWHDISIVELDPEIAEVSGHGRYMGILESDAERLSEVCDNIETMLQGKA